MRYSSTFTSEDETKPKQQLSGYCQAVCSQQTCFIDLFAVTQGHYRLFGTLIPITDDITRGRPVFERGTQNAACDSIRSTYFDLCGPCLRLTTVEGGVRAFELKYVAACSGRGRIHRFYWY